MKSLRQDIITKEAGIELHMEVSMEGRTIIKRQADSLIGNFGRILAGIMGENSSDNTGRTIVVRDNQGRYAALGGSENNDIDSIDYTNPPVIHWGNQTGAYWSQYSNQAPTQDEGMFYLDTNVPAMRGLFYGVGNNDTTLYEVGVDRPNKLFTQGNAADWTNVTQANWEQELRWHAFYFQETSRDQNFLTRADIILGANDPNKDVEIEDYWLEDYIRRFSTTSTTVSTPAVQTFQSEITLSRTFTNNRSYDVDVGEVGIICAAEDYDNRTLIARDNINNFTVASGKSVTIDYVMKITNGGNGGVMAQFHQQLYRHLNDSNRVARDLNNSDRNDREAPGQWIPCGTGGDVDQEREGRGEDGQYLGPVPGTDATAVSNTNTSLLGQVPHGSQDNDLFYYGSSVEPVVTDKNNDELYFDISRLCENRGSTTITISETALYTGYNSDNDEDDRIQYATMISRHTPGTTVDIAPGEVLKLCYRLKITI